MEKKIIICFVLLSTFGFSQNKPHSHEELAVVKMELDENQEIKKPVLDLKMSIEKGFSTANSKLIASHFAANIDVSLLEEENLYSKSQAEQVIKTFLLENKPLKFSLIHHGKSPSTTYYIGVLETTTGDYRITINVRVIAKNEFISHLTIEADN